MPDLIQFKNGCQIKNTYSADGQKLSARYITVNAGVYQPLNQGQVIDNLDVNENDNVTVDGMDYLGNIEYQVGRYFDWDVTFEPAELKYLWRVHNPEGYTGSITTSSVNGPVYSYYRKDHLGNNREVWKASYTWGSAAHAAATSQRTQYYPSGLPWKYNTGDSPDTQPYKYGGKEFVEMHGLDEYDSDARWYYPAIMRTTTPDPLAEEYYDTSPYAWCLNNPVRFTDPTGCKVDLSQMSDEEKTRYELQIATQRQNSELFNSMYTSLESSKDIYVVNYGQTTSEGNEPVNGQFTPNSEGGGTVTFLANKESITGTEMSEEFFHAYQYDNRVNYENGEFNVEFEAKVFSTSVGVESGGFGEYPGMGDFQLNVRNGVYGDGQQVISPATIVSESFVKEYTSSANSYSKFNRENNIGNTHYKKNTTVAPYSLQKVVIETYKKK